MERECPVINLPIDYKLIGEAVEFYKSYGYEYIELDWMVDPQCGYATYAKEGAQYRTQSSKGFAKHLVGSAEQGFIQAVKDGKVEWDKKYVSVTPCFRRGDIGPVNNEWFMKVELNAVSDHDENIHEVMLDHAWKFFAWNGGVLDDMKLYKETPNSPNSDIVHVYHSEDWGWLELGSYGYREVPFLARQLQKDKVLIHYGTGLALPRFQLIL